MTQRCNQVNLKRIDVDIKYNNYIFRIYDFHVRALKSMSSDVNTLIQNVIVFQLSN